MWSTTATLRPKKADWQSTIRLSVLIFFSLLLITYGLIAAIYFDQKIEEHDRYKQITDVQVSSVRHTLDHELNSVLSDCSLLAEYEELLQYLKLPNEENRLRLNNAWVSFSKQKGIYDQVRFIDSTGMEVIRVNYANGVASSVPDYQLQSKKHRYYFTESLAHKQGEVYVSAFDLNIEHGEVEHPFKPMIRVATPVFDSHGSKRGVIVLNYLGGRLLEEIREREGKGEGRIMLINDKGYYLKGLSSTDEWGFMFGEQGKKKTFAKDFPQAWREISTKHSGQIDNDKGVFCFEHIVFPAVNAPVKNKALRDWILVHYVSSSELEKLFAPMREVAWMIAGLMSGILILVSWTLARFQFEKRIAQEMLRSSEEQLRLILSSAAEGVLGLDREGRTTFINVAALEMVGFSQEDLMGEYIHNQIHHSHADGTPRLRDECRVMTALESVSQLRVTDDVFWRKDGSCFPVEYKVMPLLENDEIQGAVMTFRDITDRRKAEQKLQYLATTDHLTGIYNRKKLEELMGLEIREARRYEGLASLVIFDIDHFKQVNDTYGHQTGDEVLKGVAAIAQKSIREVDILARWGGEEFLILVPTTDLGGATHIAEKIRNAIASHSFKEVGTVTASFGVAQFRPGEAEKDFVKRTDDALYRAKQLGRNRVERAD